MKRSDEKRLTENGTYPVDTAQLQKIVRALCTGNAYEDNVDPYEFTEFVAQVISDHCGGDPSVSRDSGAPVISVSENESLPDDGGIWTLIGGSKTRDLIHVNQKPSYVITQEQLLHGLSLLLKGEAKEDAVKPNEFALSLCEAICDYCGGEVGHGYTSDDHGFTVLIRHNENLPDNGGIWALDFPEASPTL